MKKTILVVVLATVAILAAVLHALTAGKSVSATIHGDTHEEPVQFITDGKTL
jgi:hypothetical protein